MSAKVMQLTEESSSCPLRPPRAHQLDTRLEDPCMIVCQCVDPLQGQDFRTAPLPARSGTDPALQWRGRCVFSVFLLGPSSPALRH